MGLKHQAAFARKWRAAIRQVESHVSPVLPSVFFLTDPDRVRDPLVVAATLPASSGVIYRHFGSNDRVHVARQLRDICKRRDLPLLIAADPKLAQDVGAQGVHWPEAQILEARKWRGSFTLQTASAHSPRALRRAQQCDIDALLYSTVFQSQSPSAGRPVGPLRLRRLARDTTRPIYALGGVNAQNSQRVAEFAGLAAIEGLIAS